MTYLSAENSLTLMTEQTFSSGPMSIRRLIGLPRPALSPSGISYTLIQNMLAFFGENQDIVMGGSDKYPGNGILFLQPESPFAHRAPVHAAVGAEGGSFDIAVVGAQK